MASPTLEIAKREFLEHVLSWRFALALVLSTLILVTSMVALTATYQEDLDSYNARQEMFEGYGSQMTSEAEKSRHLAKPNLLSVFVGGPGDHHRIKYAERQGAYDPSVSAQPGSWSPTNTKFAPLDLGFVAAVMLTFMAVLFSFDGVSGEKERGTLKLVLANPVPKDAVLLGKYLGGLSSILVALAVAIVAALATLSLRGLALTGEEAARLGIIALLGMLLASAFYLLGLLVSSLCRRSGTSLLALTTVWLVLVFAVGNVAGFAAKETTPILSNSEIQERERVIFDATEAAAAAVGAQMGPLHAKKAQGNLSPAEEARLEQLNQDLQAAYAKGEADRKALRAAAIRQLDGQLRRAEAIASASVVESFRTLATKLAMSDYWSYRELVDRVADYQREVDRAYQEWLKDNPPTQQAGPGGISYGTQSGAGFEAPRMHYEPPTIQEQLSSPAGVRAVLVLIAYNLAAFTGAYIAILRYDVR